jgi:hypothetical protein
VAGSCERGDEPSASIKRWEILEQAESLVASEEGFCCMKLAVSEEKPKLRTS